MSGVNGDRCVDGKLLRSMDMDRNELARVKIRALVAMAVREQGRMLRRILGPKWEEVTGDWRKLHNWSFMICASHHVAYYSGDQYGTCGG